MRLVMCNTPKEYCNGKRCDATASLGKVIRAHSSSPEAFKCYVRYLISQGYERVGSREFKRPGEAILILSKPSHYGGVLRGGKRGGKGEASKRVTPFKNGRALLIV